MLKYFHRSNTFPQQFWFVPFSRNLLIGSVFSPIPLFNGRNLQYLHQNFYATSFLVRLNCKYNLYSSIVQLYRTYSFYYHGLRISSDLCTVYFDYSVTLTQTLFPYSTDRPFPAARHTLDPWVQGQKCSTGGVDST